MGAATKIDEYLPITSFDVNRNTATLNMMLTRKVKLVPAAGGAPITQVAGIKLDNLSTFNNYTLVGDGELNVPYLKLKISDKKLYDALSKAEVLEADGQPATKYDASQEYTLKLDQLPVVPPSHCGIEPWESAFRQISARLTEAAAMAKGSTPPTSRGLDTPTSANALEV